MLNRPAQHQGEVKPNNITGAGPDRAGGAARAAKTHPKALKRLYYMAPIWYPTIGFLVCLITLFLAAELRDLAGNAALTFRFAARGLFQTTAVAGAVVALAARLFQELRKTLLVIFGVLAAGAAVLGWIFAQSIVHF